MIGAGGWQSLVRPVRTVCMSGGDQGYSKTVKENGSKVCLELENLESLSLHDLHNFRAPGHLASDNLIFIFASQLLLHISTGL